MAKLNIVAERPRTHEGAQGPRFSVEQRLSRSVMSCLLWEKGFYEDGVEIGLRIQELGAQVKPQFLADLAIRAREEERLRHVPLLLCSVLARTGSGTSLVSETIERVIQRPDELGEFLAIHAKVNGVGVDAVKPVLSNQMRKGLARAFRKFDEYQLAKYDRAGAGISLRDVLFLSHPNPQSKEQADIWKRLIDGELKTPDTWEVSLSAGADKKESFTRLIQSKKLGYLALLRNLRNMMDAGVDQEMVGEAIVARRGAQRVLPFRFIAAARACPQMEPWLDRALIQAVEEQPKFPGVTAILVDVSQSMDANLSDKSQVTRQDVACALAAIVPSDNKRVFSFSNELKEVAPRQGMALIDAINSSQSHSGTYLGGAVRQLVDKVPCDRLIVVTDEQSHDEVPSLNGHRARGWLINVASYQNGVGFESGWDRVNGWSDSVIRYIHEVEAMGAGELLTATGKPEVDGEAEAMGAVEAETSSAVPDFGVQGFS